MRFTVAFVASALSAVAVAQSTTASPTNSMTEAQASIVACIDDCDAKDIDCLARCNPVPNPSENQVIQLDKCVGNCPKGDGSDAESKKYENCRADCIAEWYYNPTEGTPQATGGSGSSGSSGNNGDAKTTGTDSASGADSTGDSNSEDDSNNSDDNSGSRTSSEESGSGTGSASESSNTDEPDAASQLLGSGAAFFALVAAVFAL